MHGDGGQDGTSTASGLETDSASETTEAGECPGVFSGDLIIGEDTNVAEFADLGAIEGDLRVLNTTHADLSFLRCLGSVRGAINIAGNENLETLAGLENLRSADEIYISSNGSLRSAGALDRLASLEVLWISDANFFTDIGFNGLEAVDSIEIGDCGLGPDELPRGYSPTLTEINGFAKLKEVRVLQIAGHYAIQSLGTLLDVAPPPGGGAAAFYNNHKLPYAQVQTVLDRFDGFACGNLDDPEPLCSESEMWPCNIPPP